ncbi:MULTISPECIES: hypothetical protein [Bacteria]|uniref:hypothetical protein n=1 Tax=Bacteria TaxID=2 RepID=UPI003C7E9684
MAHVSHATSADDLLLGALAQPRNAASLPALAGAAAAAMFGEGWIPEGITSSEPRLTGLAIPSFAGRAVTEVVGG